MANIKDVIKKNLATKILCTLLISLAGILLFIGLQIYSDSMYQYYSRTFQKGQIAEEDLLVNNSVDIYDKEATEALIEQNRKAVLPVFNYSITSSLEAVGEFDKLRAEVSKGDYSSVPGLDASNASKIMSISYEILLNIMDKGCFNGSEIEAVINSDYSSVTLLRDSDETRYNLYESVISDDNISNILDEMLLKYEGSGLTVSESSLIRQLVSRHVKSNIYYDALLTEQRRKEAVDNTNPVYISFEKGQVLLARDRVVTDEQLHLISLLGNSSTVTVTDIVGESAFIVLSMVFAMYLFCYYLYSEKMHAVQYLWICSIGLVATCAFSFFAILQATRFNVSFFESFAPVCFVPILITMLTGRRDLGFVTSFIVGLLMSAVPGSTYLTFIYSTLNGVLCCMFVRFFNKRTDMFIQWVISLAITSALTVVFINIGAYSNREIIPSLIGNAINITGTHILIAIILPLLERIFNLPTVFMLNQLAYGNNPLLVKLNDSAPGTYSHSMMVSELSETAAKAIGANAVLARVGGLYHDIGKTEHPEYFVENQSGTNKHQELNPSLSVAVIKSHVKVGADMAREAGLPTELVDIIANHHGNDIIAYFYNEAKKQADEDDIVSSTDFSYSSSSIPETKECAVVMLADSVEAAARTIAGPTAAKFTKLINSIVIGKIERGQLDRCDLSMKEIDAVKESFLKTLSAQYHNRIEYPDEEADK